MKGDLQYEIWCSDSQTTMNLGDDIQTYAAAKLLPHVDYQIDREYISDFKSENDEPVAVIMNAWWMWKKWNWPPADCIIPKLLSMHINNYGVARKSSPIYAEWAQGCGGEFFKKVWSGWDAEMMAFALIFLKNRV